MNKKKLGIRLLSLLALGGFVLANPVFADQNFARNEKKQKIALSHLSKNQQLSKQVHEAQKILSLTKLT